MPLVETHPFEPWLPQGARLLMLGTFPPAEKRWSMPWYYPNFQNDMWRIFGLVFFSDKNYFMNDDLKSWNMTRLKGFLKTHHVAIYDTAYKVCRTKGTASDKDLKVIVPTDLDKLLDRLPALKGVLTAGQLATKLFTDHFKICEKLKMGEFSTFEYANRHIRLYRMPSSSRAYPMAIEKKADYYKKMFNEIL